MSKVRSSDPQSMQVDKADSEIVGALRQRASELQNFNDDTCRIAARIVAWAAGNDGKALRAWMLAFKDRQAKAPTWMQAVAVAENAENLNQPDSATWSLSEYEAMLTRVEEKWLAEVVSDGHGKPAEVDVPACIDRLAYWIALTTLPSSRSMLLKDVRRKALELASLLDQDGSIWASAIELFDSEHRPVLIDAVSLSVYRSFVSDRIGKQQMAPLLRNLCRQAERQARLDALKSDAKDVPRPSMPGALDRLKARRIHAWLADQCPGGSAKGIFKLIAGLINASRLPKDQRDYVGEDEVKEWLRSPRNRTKTHSKLA